MENVYKTRPKQKRHCPDCPCTPYAGENTCWNCGTTVCEEVSCEHVTTVTAETPVLNDELQTVCNNFAKQHPSMAHPRGAALKSYNAVDEFFDACIEAGIISPEGKGSEWANEQLTVVQGVPHHVARIGDLVIDWTARQFNPSVEWPKITVVVRA